MSSSSRSRGIISPEHHALLRGNPHRSAYGWDFYEGLVSDAAVLRGIHLESFAARERHVQTHVPRSRGDVSISYVEESHLHELPATHSFAEEVAQSIGSRIVAAQFNFYGPGSELLGHNDGPSTDPESALVLSLSGQAVFEILPDLYANCADIQSIDVQPGDGVFLPPIPARDPRQYTSRRHALVNGDANRVSLVLSYI